MREVQKLPVFIALIEVCPLKGCQLDPNEYGGASVRCYVQAYSEGEALEKIIESLDAMQFSLAEVEWCVEESSVEWENPNDPAGIEYVQNARQSSEPVFAEFYAWGINDLE